MSLSAVVYTNIKNLEIDESLLDIDEHTGEVFFIDEDTDFNEEVFVATYKRLGNMETVNYLYGKISSFLSKEYSILLTKILYNASHSGDKIDFTEMEKLQSEIDCIRKKVNSNDWCTQEFLDTLSKLASTSIKEKNPIVFV
jgi:hypothetical protein